MSDESQEQTLFKGSPSAVMNAGTFLICAVVLAAALVVGFMQPPPWRWVLFGVGGVALIYAIVQWLFVKSRLYEVTSERIRITQGIFTRRTDELELYRVKDTTLIEPLSLRMLSLGHIDISTHDMTTPFLRLEAIHGAPALREELRKSIEACRDKKRVRLAELE